MTMRSLASLLRPAALVASLLRPAALVAAGTILSLLCASTDARAAAAEPVRVFATTTDLAALAKEIGGDRVSVVSMVKGREDPHFAEARPSFIKELSRADLFVVVGLELEVGYVPLLLENARNPRVLLGGPGYVDASKAIAPLGVPRGIVDRSMGDVHPYGSPHYLLDPLRGLEVATLLASKLSELRPGESASFTANLAEFRGRMAVALVGEALAAKYDAFKLAVLYEKGGLASFLDSQGDRAALGGWLGLLLPYRGAKVVDDHNMWTYFAGRFGVVVSDHLEPKPGLPPTTAHLGKVVARMEAEDVRVVVASPYYDPRHAAFVAKATGARVAELTHQVGGRAGTDDYLSMIDFNVRTLAAALRGPE